MLNIIILKNLTKKARKNVYVKKIIIKKDLQHLANLQYQQKLKVEHKQDQTQYSSMNNDHLVVQ